MRSKKVYILINSIVVLTLILSILFLWNNLFIIEPKYILFAIVPFILIHLLRLIRQYIILMEYKMRFKDLTKAYLLSSLTNTVVPFKFGELYKIYLYGYEMKNYKKSVIGVLTDKFFDAVFLLVLFVIAEIINSKTLSLITVLLFIFVVIVIVMYISFDNTYKFLNKYLITNKKSKLSIKCLKILEEFKNLFFDIKNMIKGREILIVLLTIFSWLAEICFVFIIGQAISIKLDMMKYIKYMNSSFIGVQNELSNCYICITFVLFIVFSIIFILSKIFDRKKS